MEGEQKPEKVGPPLWVFRSGVPKPRPLNFNTAMPGVDEQSRSTLVAISTARSELVSALAAENAEVSIACIDKYLPMLIGLMHATTALPADFCSKLSVSWCMPFTLKFVESPAIVPSLRYELVMVLLSYGLMHRKVAAQYLGSPGSSRDDEKLKLCSNWLCRAAGIFEHTAQLPLSAWTQGLVTTEMTTELHTAFSLLSLLEAQSLVVAKGDKNGTAPSALAKLCLDISSKAKYASSLVEKAVQVARGQQGSLLDEPRLFAMNCYLVVIGHAYHAQAHLKLGEDACKNGKYGMAVAFLLATKPNAAEEKVYNDRKTKEFMPEFLKTIAASAAEIQRVSDSYVKDNQRVYYEHVPEVSTLEIPKGAAISKPVPFAPPPAVNVQLRIHESYCCLQ